MARSAPDTPNNSLTPNVVTLPSATGFTAGDLVYYKDGDYRALPSNALSTATFDATQSLPTYQQSFGSNIANRISVGSSKGESTALLTNGNVVTVYRDISTARPVFVVTTQAGASVVAPTDVSTTALIQNGAPIGVAALSGGGFVAYWLNSAGGTTNVPNYAIYDNAGAVVTAATQDVGLGAANANGYIAGVALPNGGFALSYLVNSGTSVVTRAYGATGTPAFAWTTVGSVVSDTRQRISMAARSDSSYMVLYQQSATSVFRYTVFSAAGATLNTSTFTGTIAAGTYTNAPVTATVLADGTTFVIGYSVYDGSAVANSYYFYCFRFLPSSFTLSAETVIPPTNTNLLVVSTKEPGVLSVKALAAGGFVYAFVDPSGAIYYAFFNNSGVAVSGTNLGGALVFPIPGAYLAYIRKDLTIVEYGGNVNLFWGVGVFDQNSPMIQTAAISTTTYQLINYRPVTDSLGTVTAPVSGLSNTSTPVAARFLASANVSQTLTRGIGFTIAPTIITAGACDSVQVASMGDGNFVVVYRGDTTPFPVTAVIYNRFGVVVQTIAVGNGSSFSTERDVAVAVLTDGTIVVGFHTGDQILTLNTYTLSGGVYSLSNTFTTTQVANSNGSIRFSLSAITNNRFVLFSQNPVSAWAVAFVFSSGLSILAGPIIAATGSAQFHTVNAFVGGGFVCSFQVSGNNYRNVSFRENAPNSFTAVSTATYAGVTNNRGFGAVVSPGNIIASNPGQSSNTVFRIFSYDPLATATAGAGLEFSSISNFESGGLGVTGAGSFVMFFPAEFTAIDGRAIAFNSGLDGDDTVPPTTGAQVLTFPSYSVFTSGSRAQVYSAPGVGYNCIFVWLNANKSPTYTMLYAYPSTTVATVTSGVSLSAPQPITANSNLPLNGYVLQGVAVTSAPAGGTGQVQTNGIARLNSNYSPSTPASAFDFQTPNGTNIPGVKGTAIGNTVILEGRS